MLDAILFFEVNMKQLYWVLFLGMTLLAGCVCIGQELGPATNDVPTQAEIDSFVTRYSDGAGGEYVLQAAFRLPTFPPAAWRLYQKSDKIPYHLTASLARSGEMILDKEVEVFIVDAEGKLVDHVKEPILGLCPS